MRHSHELTDVVELAPDYAEGWNRRAYHPRPLEKSAESKPVCGGVSDGISKIALRSRPSRAIGRRTRWINFRLGLGRLANRLGRWVHLRRIRQMRISVAGLRWVGIGHCHYPSNPNRVFQASWRSRRLIARLSATAAAYLSSAVSIAFCNAALAVRNDPVTLYSAAAAH